MQIHSRNPFIVFIHYLRYTTYYYRIHMASLNDKLKFVLLNYMLFLVCYNLQHQNRFSFIFISSICMCIYVLSRETRFHRLYTDVQIYFIYTSLLKWKNKPCDVLIHILSAIYSLHLIDNVTWHQFFRNTAGRKSRARFTCLHFSVLPFYFTQNFHRVI